MSDTDASSWEGWLVEVARDDGTPSNIGRQAIVVRCSVIYVTWVDAKGIGAPLQNEAYNGRAYPREFIKRIAPPEVARLLYGDLS